MRELIEQWIIDNDHYNKWTWTQLADADDETLIEILDSIVVDLCHDS